MLQALPKTVRDRAITLLLTGNFPEAKALLHHYLNIKGETSTAPECMPTKDGNTTT